MEQMILLDLDPQLIQRHNLLQEEPGGVMPKKRDLEVRMAELKEKQEDLALEKAVKELKTRREVRRASSGRIRRKK